MIESKISQNIKVTKEERLTTIRGYLNEFDQLNKEINFIIKGGDIEIDKKITESIVEPLVHLLRNSMDHGFAPQKLNFSKNRSCPQ